MTPPRLATFTLTLLVGVPLTLAFAQVPAPAEGCPIALTYDDGPGAATTPQLLDFLEKKQIPATFFVLGNAWKAQPAIAKRLAGNDLFDVAHHSQTHPAFAKGLKDMGPSDRAKRIQRLMQTEIDPLLRDPLYRSAIQAQGGWQTIRLPYGSGSSEPDLQRALAKKGFNPSNVRWDVDPEDWDVQKMLVKTGPRGEDVRRATEEERPAIVAKRMLEGHKADPIWPGVKELCTKHPGRPINILLHDIHAHSVEATKIFVAEIEKLNQALPKGAKPWTFVKVRNLPPESPSFRWAPEQEKTIPAEQLRVHPRLPTGEEFNLSAPSEEEVQ